MKVVKRTVNISDINVPFIHNERMGLLEDIKKNGLKKRIWLKRLPNGRYFVRNGRHRVACCLKLGMTRIPSVVSKVEEEI